MIKTPQNGRERFKRVLWKLLASCRAVSHSIVGNVRKEMEEAGQLDRLTSLIGADGKERPRQVNRPLFLKANKSEIKKDTRSDTL